MQKAESANTNTNTNATAAAAGAASKAKQRGRPKAKGKAESQVAVAEVSAAMETGQEQNTLPLQKSETKAAPVVASDVPKVLWTVEQISTGNISKVPHLFSQDEKYLICASDNYIVVFSASTGDWVRKLKKHKERITSVILNPFNSLQVISASLEGLLCIWDLTDGSLIRTIQMDHPVMQLLPNHSTPNAIYAALYVPESGAADKAVNFYDRFAIEKMFVEENRSFKSKLEKDVPPVYSLFAVDLQSGKSSQMEPKIEGYGFSTSSDGSLIVGYHNVQINVFVREVGLLHTWVHNQVITCAVAHPNLDMFAIGDCTGTIYLWRNIRTIAINGSPSKTKLHWHSKPVSDIKFTDDGLYILSVGKETVFVIWQIETLQNQFLPRLGAPLRNISISPSGKYYAISNDDNEVLVILSSSMAIKAIAQGLKIASDRAAASSCVGLLQHPNKQLMLSNGAPGKLQMFQLHPERYIGDIPVINASQHTRASDSFVVAARIDFICILPNGNHFVAATRMLDSEASEVSLKFWSFTSNSSAPSAVLNTRVDAPHKGRITSVIAHPRKNVVVTTSSDGRFKTWILTKQKENDPTRTSDEVRYYWGCRSVGVYRNYQARYAAFSHDGSILAVAFENIITLWDAETNEMKSTISHPSIQNHFSCIGFIRDTQYLVSLSESRLCVWDILSNSLVWEMEMRVSEVFFDPSTDRFGVLIHKTSKSKYSYVLVMNHKSPQPIETIMVPDHLQSASFYQIPESTETSIIAYNSKKEIVQFQRKDKRLDAKSKILEQTVQQTNNFKRIFGDLPAVSQTSNPDADDSETRANVKFTQLISAPAHILPSIEQIFDSFIETSMERIHISSNLDDVPTEGLTDAAPNEQDSTRGDEKMNGAGNTHKANAEPESISNSEVKYNFGGFANLINSLSKPVPQKMPEEKQSTTTTPAKAGSAPTPRKKNTSSK